nr:hypothetical protein [Tanacetum cinerariifolium]
MLKKENYVPWSSRLLRYAKSRPNGKLIHNSIINGPYVRRMILEPGDTNWEVPVNEIFHVQTDDELTEKKLKKIEGSDIEIQEKKAKLLNEWEMFTSNEGESNELKAKRLAKIQDPLALMRISSNLRNRQIAQPGMNMCQDRQMQMVGVARDEGNAAGPNGNKIRCYNCMRVGHFTRNCMMDQLRNCMVRPRRRDAAYLQTQLLIAQKEEAGIQLQAEEFDLMAAAADLDEIKEYIELLKPIPEQHQVPQNDNDVISEVTSVEQGRETVEQHPTNFEETCALYDLLYQNLAIEVEKVNSVNCKLKETNVDLTTELARFKNQEKCFEISQEKYDKLERCYQ